MFAWLAQSDPTGGTGGGGGAGGGATSVFTNIFWLTIGFIFLTAIFSAVVARRQRDRVLRLMHDFRVTMMLANGATVWGDLWVYPQGLEVRFDSAYRTESGIIKSSYMLYETDANQLLAMCRWACDQTEHERASRREQVERRADPGPMRRFWRGVRNWFNTIRDAFTQAFGAILGTIGKARPGGVLQTQQGHVERIGQTLIQSPAPGFAYEPMLEKHIGRPVILEMAIPNDPQNPRKPSVDLPGYLAEYSKDYVAIFNIDHRPTATLDLPLDESAERDGLKIDVQPRQVTITNLGAVPLVIEALIGKGGGSSPLGIVLLQNCTARLPRPDGAARLRLLRIPHLDIACPRTQARVRHAALNELSTELPASPPPAALGKVQ